jgi:hypothetical protein
MGDFLLMVRLIHIHMREKFLYFSKSVVTSFIPNHNRSSLFLFSETANRVGWVDEGTLIKLILLSFLPLHQTPANPCVHRTDR